jgi:hypothetical protein
MFPAGLSDRLAEAERARDDAAQKLDSHKRAAARSEREWELERQQLQVQRKNELACNSNSSKIVEAARV